MLKHILFSLLLLSVVLGISQQVVATEEDVEYIRVCRFDKNHDGIVNIGDFPYIRRQMQDWNQERRDVYFEQYRLSFGRICYRNLE